ncbi:putative lipoprotein [Thioflavicoccus mobilis 8321]|uniref:Putative lipoprotein n=1 Tax=Thioflavicoccus mobilis 8321 TaxID=765912 RepID=L0H099_9GAMM|nr:outer membrane protein assembly factor BamC [Thioflavicoccus mobilis]AGA91656.1 putative lipoprotein [Thioflavicoccus mobilis 8321]
MLIGLLLAGCGSSGLKNIAPDQRLAYKRQQEAAENLEIPPDLTAATFDDALDIPAAGGGATTYSEFEGQRSRRQQMAATTSGAVLPDVKGVELRREGDNRWLEVEAMPQQVWPKIVAFWREQGILLVEQDPATGTMRTDWLDNRAEIRQDFVTNMLRKVVDGLYATSTRDQYRVRIEPGLDRGTTDIYLTHRGMEEKLVRNTAGEGTNTVWEPAGSDPGKEAEMLRRLMIYLGVSEQGAKRMIAQGTKEPSISRLVTGADGPALMISEEFRRAWRVTGLALDRVGFAVEDQDYTNGVFFVRYADTDKVSEKKGLVSKLAFWQSGDKKGVAKYQVKLVGSGDQTRVTVLDAAGQREKSDTAQRILRLLQEEIR